MAIVGVPMDHGTSNRPGTRLGPRQIRDESRMLRPFNMATGAAPFAHLQVADIGDVAVNTFDLKKTVDINTAHYDAVLAHDVKRRGSLTIWFDPAMTWEAAPTGKRGRQPDYSDAAIQTCLTMKGEGRPENSPVDCFQP